MNPLKVTRYTAVSSLGSGNRATLAALEAQRSGLAPCRFETVDLPTHVGEVPALASERIPEPLARFNSRNHRLAHRALVQDEFEEAVSACVRRFGKGRVGVFLGTSTSGILETELAYRKRDSHTGALPLAFDYRSTHNPFALAEFVRARLKLAGPASVVCTACSSSAKVFATAQRMIDVGLIDAAVVGGADSLCLTTLYGFHSLQLVSAMPCRPFDAARDGISIGEAAAFILLERTPAAHATPGTLLLLGCGESSDAYHMSSPHPEGEGAHAAMSRALERAGLRPDEIDYINFHGTATPSNDAAESRAVRTVLGSRVPGSSTKGATGHTLGAAGALEAVICLLALEHQLLPAGLNTTTVDPTLEVEYVRVNRHAVLRRVMSNSFGFGGSNCTLIFGTA